MEVEKWWGMSVDSWTILDYANRQEFMFLQNEMTRRAYDGTSESESNSNQREWKGPYQDG